MRWWIGLSKNMLIEKSSRFSKELENVVSFIAIDSIIRAENFYNELLQNLDKLSFMPYKFRQSNSFKDENIRDYIFKGYVIPYKIDTKKDTIIILGIYKENEW